MEGRGGGTDNGRTARSKTPLISLGRESSGLFVNGPSTRGGQIEGE
jgi:hypothetical protein